MKLHTEQEFIEQSQYFAYKLRNLYLKDQTLFFQMAEYLPNAIHINKQQNLDLTYANNQLMCRGPEIEDLFTYGSSYLPKISCENWLNYALKKVESFKRKNDFNATCSYIQHIQVNQKMKYLYTDKLILDNTLFFNVSSFTEDLGLIGKTFDYVFQPILSSREHWRRFKALTKREKEIIKLLGTGHSLKSISDLLNLSILTIQTHKKNIHHKLDITKTSELVKFAAALEIL